MVPAPPRRASFLALRSLVAALALAGTAQAQPLQTGAGTIAGGAALFDVPGAATTYSAPGATPWMIPFQPGQGLRFTFPSITGSVGCGTGTMVGAEGGLCTIPSAANPDGRTVVGGANGISGIWMSGQPARQMALTGVFLDSSAPGHPAPPVIYDSAGAYDFRTSAPALNQAFFIGDGSVRFVNDGSSFRVGDGSVRVLADGASNTVLFGEGGASFTGNDTTGHTVRVGDGSVRFIRDGLGGWQYQRSDAGGTVVDSGTPGNDANFAFTDGSVRFLADGTSNTVLFGEANVALQGNATTGWQATFTDGSVRNLGSTAAFLPGDGSVRFVNDGSSFRVGDGSVRVLADGASNTVLFGEGGASFTGNDTTGHTVRFGDGSVRFIRDGLGGWQYQRSDAGGTVVDSGTPGNDANFAFGDGSVRFIADGLSNTLLFGENNVDLRQAPDGRWMAVYTDGSVRQLGDGRSALFGDGSVRFLSDGVSNTVLFGEGGSAPAGTGPAFFYDDGTILPAPPQALYGWSQIGDATGITDILDGVSNTLLLQEFIAPQGANRLVIGFVDTDGQLVPIGSPGGYQDNTGQLFFTYELHAVPAPSAALTLGAGLLALGLLRRRTS